MVNISRIARQNSSRSIFIETSFTDSYVQFIKKYSASEFILSGSWMAVMPRGIIILSGNYLGGIRQRKMA